MSKTHTPAIAGPVKAVTSAVPAGAEVTNADPNESRRLYALMEENNTLFTQYKKVGDVMDTFEPEFHVRLAEPIGEPVNFTTETLGYYGFFKYRFGEIEALMPPEANAFRFASNVKLVWTDGNPDHQQTTVQFYKADIDTSAHIMRRQVLENNFDLIMSLLDRKAAS